MIQVAIHQSETKAVAMQRARGRAFLSISVARGESRLVDLSQSGSARIMLPRVTGSRPEAVFLNTSGGLTSGDCLDYGISVDAGAALTATTQTAERAYLAPTGPARLAIRADVGAKASLDWLPQETILFQGAALSRETRIELGPEAHCLLVEIVVLGRRAMGEVVTNVRFTDRRVVNVQGRPLHIESVDLSSDALARSSTIAMLGPAHVFASVAYCGPGTEDAAATLRSLNVPADVTAATSGWNGRTLLRATATDLWPLKVYLGRVIALLTGQPLPRVWQMQGLAP